MKILIVEDEVNAREGLADLLSKISQEYIVCGKASDGEQGLILSKELKPDLIFVDIEMPRLNGLQMIEKINESGEEPYFVILSGYSDFKYAQKGISLGVSEYLLKPITYINLKNLMTEMSRKFNLKKEKAKLLRQYISEEELLEKIMLNSGKDIEEAYKVIESNINQEENIYLLNFYLRDRYKDKSKIIIEELHNFMGYHNIKTFYYSTLKEYNYLPILINTKISFLEILKMLKYNLLFYVRKNGFPDITVSIINLSDRLGEIKNSLDKLHGLSKWPIVLGNEEIIHEELISKLKISYCSYPKDIENEALFVIKNNEYKKLININKRLISYLKANIYNPTEIIETCSNYIFSILTFLKGYNTNFYNSFKNEGILDDIRRSYTISELKEHLDALVDIICKRCGEDLISSLPVRKAINYIKEYYNYKISLDEIANSMNITPEYLSRLFTKEIGKSFSDYLKEYRIENAKKLMSNDKLKIYQIAKKVGYSDPKYFCKVFKEVTGMTPKEYLKFY